MEWLTVGRSFKKSTRRAVSEPRAVSFRLPADLHAGTSQMAKSTLRQADELDRNRRLAARNSGRDREREPGTLGFSKRFGSVVLESQLYLSYIRILVFSVSYSSWDGSTHPVTSHRKKVSMEAIYIIGIDLAKQGFQLHGARVDESVAFRK